MLNSNWFVTRYQICDALIGWIIMMIMLNKQRWPSFHPTIFQLTIIVLLKGQITSKWCHIFHQKIYVNISSLCSKLHHLDMIQTLEITDESQIGRYLFQQILNSMRKRKKCSNNYYGLVWKKLTNVTFSY